MGLINLPSLVQKIKVDTSDMKRAEGEATAFGTTMKKSNEESGASLDALKAKQKEFADSTTEMSEKVKECTKSFSEQTKTYEENRKSQERHRKSTKDSEGAFDGLVKKIDGAGKSFSGLNVSISDLKIPLIASGAGAAVGSIAALTAGVGALVAQFGPAIGVVGAYAPAMLALKTSTSLVSGAFKELTDSKAPANAAKDLQKIQENGVKAFSPGFLQSIKNVTPAIEEVDRGYVKLGKTLGSAFASSSKELMQQPTFLRNLGTVMDNNAKLAGTFAQALAPIANIIVNITKAAGPMAQHFAEDFVEGAQAVSNMSNNTGKLETFFAKAEKTARQVIGSVVDLGVAIKNVFAIGAKSVGIDFVGGLQGGAKSLREYTESAKGVKQISDYFAQAGPIIKEIGLLIRDVVTDMFGLGNNQDLAGFIKLLRTETLPAVNDLAQGAGNNLLPTIAHLMTAFAEFNNTLSFSPLITTIDTFATLATAAANVVQAVPGLGEFVSMLLLIKTTSKGFAIASNFTGVTTLVTALKDVGPAGKAGATGLAGFLQGMRGASGETKTLANSMGSGVKAAFIGLGSALSSLGTALVTAGASVKAFTLSLLTNPIVLIVAAIVALGIALYELYKHNETFRNGVKAVWDAIKSAIGAVADWITGTAIPAIISAWNAIKDGIGAVVSWITGTMVPAITSAWDKVVGAATTVKDVVVGAWNALVDGIKVVTTIVTEIGYVFLGLVVVIVTVMDKIYSAVVDKFVAIGKGILDVLDVILSPISDAVRTAVGFIVDNLNTAFEFWKTILSSMADFLGGILSTIGSAFMTGMGYLKDTAVGAASFIGDAFRSAWDGVKAIWSAGTSAVSSLFKAAADVWKTLSSTVTNALKTVFSAAWDAIKAVFNGALTTIKGFLSQHFGSVPGIVKSGMDQAWSVISGAWDRIKTTVQGGINAVLNETRQLGSKVANSIGDLANLLYSKGQQVVQGLINGIKSMFSSLSNTGRDMASKIASFLPGSPVKEGPLRVLNKGYAGKQIVKMINDGITKSDGIQLDTSGITKKLADVKAVASVGNFPRPPQAITAAPSSSSVNNARTYNVTINETTGPSTASSITSRLRLIDEML